MSLAFQNNFKIERLKDRSFMLQTCRSFFESRGVLEVDCPLLNQFACIDAHIDLIAATYSKSEVRYLHSSPEYGMKRLLAEGIGDIYQLAHVFRDGELSYKHNPEFMMAEWYRIGFTLEQMIQETADFIRLFLGNLRLQTIHYRALFIKETGIDSCKASAKELFDYIKKEGISYYPEIESEGKDALLNLILGSKIEPSLGKEELTVLAYYPASQAALAKRNVIEGEEVAERFEIYYQGIELANGYHELGDSKEQSLRLDEANAHRIELNKLPLPIDHLFIEALRKGLPDCCGVAVGFDRLMMLRQKQTDIAEVLSWGWEKS